MSDENDIPEDMFEGTDWSQLEDLANGETPTPPDVEQMVVSPEMLARRILWDIGQCDEVENMEKVLGLSPMSSDVSDKEHEESHQRLTAAAPVALLVQEMARHASRAITAAILVGQGADSLDEESKREAEEKLDALVFQSSYAIIAELIDFGMLHLPHYFVGSLDDFLREHGDGSDG